MAVKNNTMFEGLSVPYEKVCSFSGSKDRIKVTIGNSAGYGFNPVSFRDVEIGEALSEKITEMIYIELKQAGFIIGEDC